MELSPGYFDYSRAEPEIRGDLPAAYRQIWQVIALPGSWWNGQDRVNIAAETRAARQCSFCAQRKNALSPMTVNGEHDSHTNLPRDAIDAVHRITTDAARLTKTWLDDLELTDEQYVELLGVSVAVISIDAFHHAMGLDLETLPDPEPGAPDNYRPAKTRPGRAWVPIISAADAEKPESDLYGGAKQTGNVVSAMSLVPASVRMLHTLSGVQYLRMQDVPNATKNGGRELSRAQIELLAGRVSFLSDCFY